MPVPAKKLTRKQKEELAALLEEKNRRQETRKSRESAEYFTTNYVRIEDRDRLLYRLRRA